MSSTTAAVLSFSIQDRCIQFQGKSRQTGGRLFGLRFFKVGKNQAAVQRTPLSLPRNSRLVGKMMIRTLF